jgi:hypothetical protein
MLVPPDEGTESARLQIAAAFELKNAALGANHRTGGEVLDPSGLFAVRGRDLGCLRTTDHRAHLHGTPPHRCAPKRDCWRLHYRCSVEAQDADRFRWGGRRSVTLVAECWQ